MTNDYSKLARDITDIVDNARAKQACFLAALNITVEDIMAMNSDKRAAIDAAYKIYHDYA